MLIKDIIFKSSLYSIFIISQILVFGCFEIIPLSEIIAWFLIGLYLLSIISMVIIAMIDAKNS